MSYCESFDEATHSVGYCGTWLVAQITNWGSSEKPVQAGLFFFVQNA